MIKIWTLILIRFINKKKRSPMMFIIDCKKSTDIFFSISRQFTKRKIEFIMKYCIAVYFQNLSSNYLISFLDRWLRVDIKTMRSSFMFELELDKSYNIVRRIYQHISNMKYVYYCCTKQYSIYSGSWILYSLIHQNTFVTIVWMQKRRKHDYRC
jgi:hypothetical protein